VSDFHRPQEFEVHLYSEGSKSKAKKMVGVNQGLQSGYLVSSWERKCGSRRFESEESDQHADRTLVTLGVVLGDGTT
jgi:hypothetical protein